MTRSNAVERWLKGCGVVLVAVRVFAGGVLVARGDGEVQPQTEKGEKTEVWRNAWGTDRTFPFRLEEGRSTEESSVDVLSRADWVVEEGGRTYLLYERDPDNREPDEALWIGLVGEDAEILRKILLAAEVKDISGVRRDEGGGAYVEATDGEGTRQRIPLRYPEPWPELETDGGAWNGYLARIMRLEARLWEDWPDSGSGYAAEHVSAWVEDARKEECAKVVERLRAAGIPESCQAELEGEPGRTEARAREMVGDSSAMAYSQHWANVEDAAARDAFMSTYLRNWFEGTDHPKEWALVCGARGEFRGETFQATNGVALAGWKEGEEKGWEVRGGWWLIRLAPERVREENGRTLVGFDLIEPRNPDAAYLSGSGTFEEDADGMLRVAELELRKRGGGDEFEDAQGGYGEEEKDEEEWEEERE